MIRFWVNHHLLDLVERPVWRVLKGRSQAYVDACVRQLQAMGHEVHCHAQVASVTRRKEGGVALRVAGRPGQLAFDHVVLATHSDVSLKILGEAATPEEKAALGAIKYQDNAIYLHTDTALMPRNRQTWASWNCIQPAQAEAAAAAAAAGAGAAAPSVCVSYWVNLLQNLPEGAPDVFVTLNPRAPPDAAKTLRTLSLAHPLFNQKALEAQVRCLHRRRTCLRRRRICLRRRRRRLLIHPLRHIHHLLLLDLRPRPLCAGSAHGRAAGRGRRLVRRRVVRLWLP